MPDLQQIAENLSQLTVIEAAELSRMLEQKWGVSAAVQAVQTVAIPEVVPVEAVQDEFSVILAGFAVDKKVTVIKEVRAITGLGLKEAKDFTEQAGPTKVIKDSLTKTDAEALKTRLEAIGATVMIQ